MAGCSSPAPRRSEQSTTAPTARITQFYPSPSRIGKGERAELCYSVDGATSVTLAPPAEEVWPALSRCFEVQPSTTTAYTLTARDPAGHAVSEKATIEVGPARSPSEVAASGARMIKEVQVSQLQISPGGEVTICYTARKAASIKITPARGATPSADRGCVTDRPTQTTTYEVIATGPGGQTDSERVTVKVQ